MFESKKELLEKKLELQREDFYQKGRILAKNNESIEALNDYKESYIEFQNTMKELNEIVEEEKQREEEIIARIRSSHKYKVAKQCADDLDNFIEKCKDIYKKIYKKK